LQFTNRAPLIEPEALHQACNLPIRGLNELSVQKALMEDEKIDEEVWSAIRYLDPDEPGKDRGADPATSLAISVLFLILGGAWILLWLRLT